MPKDLYKILEVERSASDQEIKKAYRRLAQKHHPDRTHNKADEEKIKEINVAYEILSDKKKREQYDQFGSTGGGPSGFGEGGGQGFNGFDFGDMSGFGDIFETFFGGGGGGGRQARRAGPRPGADLETVINLNFEEAIFGVEKEIGITRLEKCEHCQGNGAEPGSKIETCSTCHGTGEVTAVQQTFLGQIRSTHACSACHGEGKVAQKPCHLCGTSGSARQTRKIKVKIPAGVNTGSVVRMKGEGEAGAKGGRVGNLYIHTRVASSNKFKREGDNIYSEIEIHFIQAILGDEIDLDTVDGPIKMKIPAGTQSGQTFRLSDHGVPRLQASGRGDHLVKVIVKIPQKIGKAERAHFEELAKIYNIKVKAEEGFLDKFF